MEIDGGLRKLFKDNVLRAQWTPIETGMVAQGVPDSEYCLEGGFQGWIEFKQCGANKIKIRPMQVQWIERRVRMGGRVWIGVRRKEELFLYNGGAVRALFDVGLKGASPRGSWSGGPARWDWSAVRKILADG